MAEKTEAPTPRRREEARAKGQGVGRSWEFSMGLTLGVGTLALSTLLPGVARNLVERTQATVINLNPRASDSEIIGAAGDAIVSMVMLVLPLAALVMVAGIAGNLVSGGLVFSYRAVRFDMSRINPISGFKRIVDRQALVRLGLATTKLAILTVISYQIVGSRIPGVVNSQGSTAAQIAGACLASIFELGLTITILLAVVALIDFVVQRRRAMESIKMTKEEVKQEYRESEGDPYVRSARKRRARQMAFARMMDAVPTADVIITNPTTLAVALKYDSLKMRAPQIVAKGQRLMAERIKQLARENKVPIVEDKPLARALFSRPVGSEVPSHLYRAVARLLVLVHQARFARQAAARGGAGGGGGGRGAGGGRGWTPEQARAAGGGLNTRPWWGPGAHGARTLAGTNLVATGEVIERQRDVDAATATQLYGGRAANETDIDSTGIDPTGIGGATQAAEARGTDGTGESGDLDVGDGLDFDETNDPDDTLDGTLELDGYETDEARIRPEEVDEAALAIALDDDELKDLSEEELAAFEAEREGGHEPAVDRKGETGSTTGTRTADTRAAAEAQAPATEQERER